MKRARKIVVATCLLALADAVTTLVGLHLGFFKELNPVLALPLLHGVVAFILVKSLLTAFWAVTSWFNTPLWLSIINSAVMCGYSVVVSVNTIHLVARVL